MFNSKKIKKIEDSIKNIVISANRVVSEINNKLSKHIELDLTQQELNDAKLKKLDDKYKTVIIKILDHFNLELDLDEENRIKINYKGKAKTAKLGKKNSSIRDKASKKGK